VVAFYSISLAALLLAVPAYFFLVPVKHDLRFSNNRLKAHAMIEYPLTTIPI
jgi:hypothetical protein